MTANIIRASQEYRDKLYSYLMLLRPKFGDKYITYCVDEALNVENPPDQNMTLQQVIEIDRDGLVEIGAHTLDHPFLARESDDKSKYEIEESVSQLESLLGHPISCFAYPNGTSGEDFGEREILTLKKTDCKIAFSTKAEDFSKRNNHYAIPRYGLSTGSMTFIRLKLMLGSKYKYLRRFLMWAKDQSKIFRNIWKFKKI